MKAYLEIEMPTNCAHCMMWSICPALPNGEWPDYESILTNDVIGDGGAAPGIRHPDCPLVAVPLHGRLIDADAVEKQIDYVASLDWNKKVGASGGMLAALEIVEDAPTILEAEEGK